MQLVRVFFLQRVQQVAASQSCNGRLRHPAEAKWPRTTCQAQCKAFRACSAPASQAFCLRGRGRAKLKKLCIESGVFLVAACLQQGSDKEQEEEKPREADEEGGGTSLKPSGQEQHARLSPKFLTLLCLRFAGILPAKQRQSKGQKAVY